ncbi:carboxypeptidase-like regulatory domain-containing protein, partial [Campylobacter jejuni]|nr:carboxypeptidase-like regulatory domain-containing protein [Campylobacter jejuni]
MTVEETLRQVLGDSFEYKFVGKTIVISPKVATPQSKSIRIKGFVYDTKKQSIPGVTVILKGTSVGTATNVDGFFLLPLSV